TDLPLPEGGVQQADARGRRLKGQRFARVFTSPLQRAANTCERAGFGDVAEIDPDLLEWNYGRYEGRTSKDIHAERPDWDLFRDGGPDAESPARGAAGAARLVKKVPSSDGDVLVFSSGPILRVLGARWLGLEPGAARYLYLKTASLSALGYEHNRSRPVIQLWDDTSHVSS